MATCWRIRPPRVARHERERESVVRQPTTGPREGGAKELILEAQQVTKRFGGLVAVRESTSTSRRDRS